LSSVNIWRCSLLQRVAEAHGAASAKKAKSVLHGVIGYAVDNGVLSNDATRQVRTVLYCSEVKGARPHSGRDTHSERNRVQATLVAAREPGLNPARDALCSGRLPLDAAFGCAGSVGSEQLCQEGSSHASYSARFVRRGD
jgi:hypothetical protein